MLETGPFWNIMNQINKTENKALYQTQNRFIDYSLSEYRRSYVEASSLMENKKYIPNCPTKECIEILEKGEFINSILDIIQTK